MHIKEHSFIFNDVEFKYIELRVLTFVDCEEVMKKITKILNFLHQENFMVNCGILYNETIRAENIPEIENCPSLTIDKRDGYLRFKYWTGESTVWTYHTDDLIESLKSGTEEYHRLYEKYIFVTDIIDEFSKRFNQSIRSYNIKYNPETEDEEYDIEYKLNLDHSLSEGDGVKVIMELLDKELLLVQENNLNYLITYNILPKPGCSACEEAKRKREEEEKKNKKSSESKKVPNDSADNEGVLDKIKDKINGDKK